MTGGGGDAGAFRSRTQTARGWRQTTALLPLDVMVDIAERSDPATLVCCAATCVDMRYRIKDDPGLGGRLRLQHGDRFVRPLMRGHLVHGHQYDNWRDRKKELFLVNTVAADATTLCKITTGGIPLASRDGLIRFRVGGELRVCDKAISSSQTLPPTVFPLTLSRVPDREISYVLLVDGDNAEGVTTIRWHFHVVMAFLELSQHRRCLQLHTFSSQYGTWGRYTQIRAPSMLHGSRLQQGLGRALVVSGAMHWLCLTDIGSYVLKLHDKAAHVTATMLPESFPWGAPRNKLLATSVAGGSPIVLAADNDKISAWTQSKQTGKWQQRSQVVIETKAILQFLDKVTGSRTPTRGVQLNVVWFAERSGTVLINSCWGFFWLDLQSMKIVRWFWDHELPCMTENVAYEMNLADWVPTFSSSTL